jgi:hypothetical protein
MSNKPTLNNINVEQMYIEFYNIEPHEIMILQILYFYSFRKM